MYRFSWDECVRDLERLARLVQAGGHEIDKIVAVARGGLVPARLLSGFLGVKKVTSVGVAYADAERTHHDFYSIPEPVLDGERVLLVEDLLESGNSLIAAAEMLRSGGSRVVTASVYYQSRSNVVPDVTLGAMDGPVTFPWEVEPILRPGQVASEA